MNAVKLPGVIRLAVNTKGVTKNQGKVTQSKGKVDFLALFQLFQPNNRVSTKQLKSQSQGAAVVIQSGDKAGVKQIVSKDLQEILKSKELLGQEDGEKIEQIDAEGNIEFLLGDWVKLKRTDSKLRVADNVLHNGELLPDSKQVKNFYLPGEVVKISMGSKEGNQQLKVFPGVQNTEVLAELTGQETGENKLFKLAENKEMKNRNFILSESQDLSSTSKIKNLLNLSGEELRQEVNKLSVQELKALQHLLSANNDEPNKLLSSFDADFKNNFTREEGGELLFKEIRVSKDIRTSNLEKNKSVDPGGSKGLMMEAIKQESKANTPFKLSLQQPKQVEFMEQLSKQLILMKQENENQLELQLEPESLGKLKLNLKVENGEVVINFQVENNLVKEQLEQNLHFLKANLIRQGYNVDHIQVETNNLETDFKNQENFHNQEQSQYYGREKDDRKTPFGDWSSEELLELLREVEDGSEVKVPLGWMIYNYHYRRMNILA